MPHVFISYSRADLSFVISHLLDVCRETGYEPWYDAQGTRRRRPMGKKNT